VAITRIVVWGRWNAFMTLLFRSVIGTEYSMADRP
jgi:hypothetical protein